jgi:chromosome partitioning protein
MAKPKRIAVASRKGGVAKTTSAANLAACFAELGQRVLLIDLDPQGHSTLYFGIKVDPRAGSGAFHVIRHETPAADVIVQTSFGVDLLSGAADLAHAEEHMRNEAGAELQLRDALDAMGDRYDVVIFDCPPQLGRLAAAGLAAATTVLVPCTRDSLALDGLAKVSETIRGVRRFNVDLRLGAVLECRVETDSKQSTHEQQVHSELVRSVGDLLLRSTIRTSKQFPPAYDHGSPITAFAPKSIGARDYRAAARELVERGLA